jgi:hypothetical protein
VLQTFSGDQPCHCETKSQRFTHLLCLFHQGRSLERPYRHLHQSVKSMLLRFCVLCSNRAESVCVVVHPTVTVHRIAYINKKKRGNIPVTCGGGPMGCDTLRLSHFLDNRLTDNGGEGVSLKRRPAGRRLPTGRFLVLISVRR